MNNRPSRPAPACGEPFAATPASCAVANKTNWPLTNAAHSFYGPLLKARVHA